MSIWHLVEKKAIEIANLAVKEFGNDGLYADAFTKHELFIPKALVSIGVRKIVAWCPQEEINKITGSYSKIIKVLNCSLLKPYTEKISVLIIPSFLNNSLIEEAIAVQDANSAIIYNITGGFKLDLENLNILTNSAYSIYQKGDHLLLKRK